MTLSEFVKKQALDRKYHLMFDWNAKNTNKFFGLLGTGFKTHMRNVIDAHPDYESAEIAFVELGRLRNMAVHENLATFTLDENTEEILTFYKNSQRFLDLLDDELYRYLQ